jgi:hypothetical protein
MHDQIAVCVLHRLANLEEDAQPLVVVSMRSAHAVTGRPSTRSITKNGVPSDDTPPSKRARDRRMLQVSQDRRSCRKRRRASSSALLDELDRDLLVELTVDALRRGRPRPCRAFPELRQQTVAADDAAVQGVGGRALDASRSMSRISGAARSIAGVSRKPSGARLRPGFLELAPERGVAVAGPIQERSPLRGSSRTASRMGAMRSHRCRSAV